MRKQWTFLPFISLILAGYQQMGKLPPQSEAVMRQQMVLDPAQIMTELAPKTQQTLDLGRMIERKPTEQLDQIRRHFINKSQ
jgi:type IV pilus assembly protein PilQ